MMSPEARHTDIKSVRWLLRCSGIAAFFVIWEGTAFWLAQTNPRADMILPSLFHVMTHSLPQLATFWGGNIRPMSEASYWGATVILSQHALITIGRLLSGLTSGIILGVGIALLLGWSSTGRRIFEPVINVIRTVPLLALLPIFLLWFGGLEVGNYLYITFGIFVMIVINALNALDNVPHVYADYARTLGASRFQVFRTVIFPAMVPEVVGGIRVAMASAWAITLAAEFLAAQTGLGRILIMSQTFGNTGRMIVIAVLFMIFAYLLNALYLWLMQKVTAWVPRT